MSHADKRARMSRALHPSARRSYSALFTVDVQDLVGETVLTLHGELDISTQQKFVSALASLDENIPRIVLDLSHLTFIDCANIGVIHQWRILAGLRGTILELRDPNPHLLRIFELTGLTASNGDGVRPIVLPLPARAYERKYAAALSN